MTPSDLVTLCEQDGVALLRFTRPILSVAVLRELESTLEEIELGTEPRPLVLVSTHPRIFLAGAHLHEIAALDSKTSSPYAERGRRVLDRLARLPVPTVAAVHGACAGGGLDLVMSCDAVVAAATAELSHPGVRRGLVTGWGGTVHLPATVGPPSARRSLLEGSPLVTHDSEHRRVVRDRTELVVASSIEKAKQLASIHPARLGLWRSFRGGDFVDRFRTFVVHNEL